jgi:hypothetical protein
MYCEYCGVVAMANPPTGTVTFLFTQIEDGGAGLWPRSDQGVPTKWALGPGPGARLWEQRPDVMGSSRRER